MSRRYGRNQRRKHREEIASLKAALARSDRKLERAKIDLESMQRDMGEITSALSIAREVLGPNHPAFEPQRLESESPLQECFNLAVRGDRPYDFYGKWRRVDVMTTKAMREHYQAAIHFITTYRGMQWGYAVSAEAFAVTPRDLLVRQIAQALALEIVGELSPGGSNPDSAARNAVMTAHGRRTW